MLEVPHPRLTQRRFALAPLAALLGEDAVVSGRTLREWLVDVRDQEIELLASSW
jgi:7,8-dihydro-6-hydroxymethylpterin-pyrophosphokinase